MKNWFFLTIIILFATKNVSGQIPEDVKNEFASNLKKRLAEYKRKSEIKDTNNANLLNKIARTYWVLDSDSAIIYANKAYRLSENINFNDGKMSSLQMLLNCSKEFGDYPSAINYGIEMYRFNQKKCDTAEMIDNLSEISGIYKDAKEYKMSIEYSKKALYLISKNNFITTPKGANKNYRNAIISELNINLGEGYNNYGLYDSAQYHFNRGYESVSVLDSSYDGWKLDPIFKLAEFSYSIKDYELSIAYIKKMEMLNKIAYLYPKSILLCKIYLAKNNSDSALKYLHLFSTNLNLKNISDSIDAVDVVETMVRVFQKVNLKDSIIKYQDLLIALKDASFRKEQVKKFEMINFKERIKDIEIEEKKYQAEQERTTNLQLGLIAIFIPTFASAVYFISKKRKKNSKIITILGLASLLMLFEFISLLIHPHIERLTHHNPMMMYLILLIIASILVPLHHKLEGYVKSKL